jgi:hypothetical protein
MGVIHSLLIGSGASLLLLSPVDVSRCAVALRYWS